MAQKKPKILQIAELASYLLDIYQKGGGANWYQFEKTIILWAKWLEALEIAAYKIYYLSQSQRANQKLIDELLIQNLRLETGLINSWNNFCLEFISQQKNYNVLYGLDTWKSFLLYRLSDSFWMPKLTRQANTKSNINALRLKFFKVLWQHNPDEMMKNFDLSLNRSQFSFTKDCLISSFSQTNSKAKRRSFISQKIIPNYDLQNTTTKTWQNFWVKHSGGILSQASFFRLEDAKSFELKAFFNKKVKKFDALIANDFNQQLLVKNVKKLLAGNAAFHVLLWGEPGMGKSSSVLALIPYFKKSNLKVIEIAPTQIFELPSIFKKLSKHPEKFILFCDDLTIDNNQSSKQLNSILDGSLIKAVNVSLHITSNRRSILKELASETADDLQKNQIAQEIGALGDRFGLKLYFEAPKFEKLNQFITAYAKKYLIEVKNAANLTKEFRKFCLFNNHFQPSARTVEQFFSQLKK